MIIQITGGDGRIEDTTAKNIFDRIGKKVYDKVHSEVHAYRDKLKGNLSFATYPNDRNPKRTTPSNPCELDYNFHTNVTSTVINPCKHKSEKRFSDTEGAQCDDRKIRGSDKTSNGGACAAYRRLHLCDKNLEQIEPDKITTHNLLADVCMAAKFEGESIRGYYALYDTQYPSSGSTICTALSRSFADIGDIIRGKDLYRGNNKKDKLQEQLKKYFQEIYDKLKDIEVRKHYEDAKGNYYKLRNAWWEANRLEVWKAITCKDVSAKYFRPACSNDGSWTQGDCRCIDGTVPTYFDYVPQYLRWFEEWAEDFCRKRKHKLQNAIEKCRGKDGKERYCDLNGYNCEKTARGAEVFVKGDNCHKCSVACNPFVEWLDNQQKEFEKQKGKYHKEMQKADTKEETSNGKINNIYEKDFYEQLKTDYGSVNQFLQKLNEERICKDPPTVGKERADHVDFTKEDVGEIFSHTEYCRACPLCGAERKSDGGNGWKAKQEKCAKEVTKEYKDEDTTTIEILTADNEKFGIYQKYKSFCDSVKNTANGATGGGQIKKWQCHYDDNNNSDVNDDSDNCILGEWKTFKNEQNPISYYSFFYNSIIEMLNDSIEWREKLKNCIEKAKEGKCRKGCKNPCECYKRWIEKKKTELEKIKEHFKKQKDIEVPADRDITLTGILNVTFLQDIEEAYPYEQQVEKIKSLLEDKMEKVFNAARPQTSIDKFLEEEQQKADECVKNNQEDPCPSIDTGSRARSDTPTQPPPAPNHHEDSSDDDDDDEEDDEDAEGEVEEVKEENQEGEPKEDNTDELGPKQGEAPKETTTTQINVCDIVKDILTKDKLQEACQQKYEYGREKFPNWKCISSGSDEKSGKDGATGSGSVCIPPRRRRLYVTPLTRWASDEATKRSTSQGSSATTQEGDGNGGSVTQPQAGDSSQGKDAASTETPESSLLRDAFIQSAAVETFFLWDRYKKENTKKPDATLGGGNGEDEDNPQSKLQKSGEIPNDFLRLMFYTLGDYADIFFGKTDIVIGKTGTGSAKDEMTQREEKIKGAIQTFFQQTGDTTPRIPGTQTQPSDKRKSLWSKYAEPIWHGMVCALTYNTDTQSGQTSITQDPNLKNALWDDTNKKPKEDKYEYKNVKLEEEETSGAKTASASGEKTTLVDFISRPPYFRYLEEWGQHFCDTRKRLLKDVRDNCTQDGKKQYSGYGEDCEDQLGDDPTNFKDLEKPSCATSCRFYRKWIERKRKEFEEQSSAYDKQKNAYGEQKEKCKKESKGGVNGFCETLQKFTTAAAFLNRLKSGPCSKKDNDDNDDGKDEINFNNPEQTFGPAKNCKPCSQFKIKCENCKSSGGDTKVTCNDNNGTITAENIKNMNKDTEIDMLVSDKSKQEFKNGLEACQDKCIFEGIRKEEWKCGKVCGYVVCKSEKGNGETASGENKDQIITIRGLVAHWVHNFLEDYNKIKHKISHCKENSEVPTCINGCVEKWINTKKEEWKTLKERFNDQYKSKDSDDYNMRSFLETLITQIPVANVKTDQEKLIKLSVFDKSCGCSADVNKQKNDDNQDAIECMLKKLEDKAKTYPGKPSEGKTQTPCGEESHRVEDDDEPLEEENPVTQPNICPQLPEEPKETCEEAVAPSGEVKTKEEERDPAAGGERQTPPAPTPAAPPAAPGPQPLPSDNTSDILKTTIPFGIALALTSIVFLYLKKKTKASVGNLFQILQIPKSDYDIPTKLSPNRYIPYTSGKYRGKRYIYLEGDSGTDSGYTDHYSDITSSSESEYEELDINDIYVPHAPKYKTLIEVVLEPSGKLSGNTIPTSGNNTTASDTQNDIQSDGIPSSKITDNEWNTLKDEFISQYLQSEQPNDIPNDYTSGNSSTNTNITTMSRDNMEEKPFITSIHDRDLYTGEEISYNINMSTNSMDDPKYVSNNVYSGIDLINDTLSGNQHIDIYDELLKRKENELFGTNHVKQTSIHSVAKLTNSDPIHNQLELFHTWLDRHRDMCEKWNNKEELLDKLNEQWNKDNNNNSDTPSDNTTPTSDIPSGKLSDIPSDNNIPSGKQVLNTDFFIQIDMNNPKTTNEFTYVDTILDDLETYNEPYYDVQDDIYYDVHDHDASTVDSNNMDVPSKVQIEMDVNTKLVKEKYPIADVWDI